MEINLCIVFGVLFFHWIADFLLQSDWMALNKSKHWDALLSHTAVYSCFWIFPLFWYSQVYPYAPAKLMLFVPITFVAHTITDYFTSRINSKLWNQKKTHWFFVSIGFDQILHYAQLLLTYYYLTNKI
jgi:hypothetical protein